MIKNVGFALDVLHDVMVDMAEAGSGLHKPHGTRPKAGAILAGQSPAHADAMECKHLLPPSQCALCLDTKELVAEMEYDKHDYVRTFEQNSTDGHDVTDEVSVGDVHPTEIYGTQTARRIKQTLSKRRA